MTNTDDSAAKSPSRLGRKGPPAIMYEDLHDHSPSQGLALFHGDSILKKRRSAAPRRENLACGTGFIGRVAVAHVQTVRG